VNPRREVPVLVDGELTVVDSADILAYLEDRHPTPPLLPESPALRVRARRWQRLADTILDAILHDISIWTWPTHRRTDAPPPGLIEAGRRDLRILLGELEAALPEKGFLCGALSVADLALFPHVSSLKPLGIVLDPAHLPRVLAWNRAMRAEPAVREDLEHVKQSAAEKFGAGSSPYEAGRIVWRGDRLEWLFHNGFHEWWLAELAAGRAVVPSPVAAPDGVT
jgi:glutathione S-transferase